MKPTWTMRQWLVVSLVLVAALSFISFFLAVFGLQLAGLLPEASVSPGVQLRSRLMQEWRSWRDPNWQRDLSADLATLGLDVRLSDPQDQTLFESTSTPLNHLSGDVRTVTAGSVTARANQRWVELLEVRDGGAPVGYVRLYRSWVQTGGIVWSQVGLILSILLTVVTLSSTAAVWLLRRVFLKPLLALTEAAYQVNEGNLEFGLPRARVREVSDVLDAFRQMAEGLRTSIVRQAAMEEERRFFLASISHDLRTPLFTLRGRLEGIRDGLAATPDRVQHYVHGALRSIAGLERLVADLFAYARLDVLEQVPARDPLDLGAIIRQVVESSDPVAEAKALTLNLEDPGQPCHLLGDLHLLTRALGNLLDNAIRHTPVGGQIAVGWVARGETVIAWIQDTGPGIPLEMLPNLFSPLYRGDSHRARAGGGTGLGLAIARRVAEAHGGTLTATNRESGGARFTLLLRANTKTDR